MLQYRDYKFFSYAKHIAKISDFERCPIGCVVVYKGKVISTGFNCHKTHPLQRLYNKYRFPEDDKPHKVHAEIHAISPLLKQDIDWRKVVLYIYRRRKDGQLGLARPCDGCMAFIKKLGIRDIYYTTDDGFCYENILNDRKESMNK